MSNKPKKSSGRKTVADEVSKVAAAAADQAKSILLSTVDQNGNGKVDMEDVIIMGLHVPGVRINRADFLQKELQKNCPQEVIDDAIESSPMHAGISARVIDRIADEVIQYERACVSGISTVLGMPVGLAMVATISADTAQYYGYLLRATQKLMYLYGFPEIDFSESGQTFDSETVNLLIVCMGVMYGVAGANAALKSLAKALATGVEKHLLRKALTRGSVYPLVKSISKWFSIKMTKTVFAGFFRKAIPIIGGVIGGSLTYVSFKPCCDRLKASLQNTMLSNPHYRALNEEDDIIIADVDAADVN